MRAEIKTSTHLGCPRMETVRALTTQWRPSRPTRQVNSIYCKLVSVTRCSSCRNFCRSKTSWLRAEIPGDTYWLGMNFRLSSGSARFCKISAGWRYCAIWGSLRTMRSITRFNSGSGLERFSIQLPEITSGESHGHDIYES